MDFYNLWVEVLALKQAVNTAVSKCYIYLWILQHVDKYAILTLVKVNNNKQLPGPTVIDRYPQP